MEQEARETDTKTANEPDQEAPLTRTEEHVTRKSSNVVHKNDIPGVEPIIESLSLAQLRANFKPQSSYSKFDLDALRVKPALESRNLVNCHLQNLYTSQKLCDLAVLVNDKKYNIHKIALTSHSEKYLTMFVDPTQTAENAEIRLVDVSHEIVKQVLEYLYTLHIDINEDNVDDILSICSQLDLKALKEKCIIYVSEFNKANVLHFLRISRRHGLRLFLKQMQDFAAQKINSIYRNPHFLLLDVEDVYAILCSSKAHQEVKKEEYILKMGVKWLKMGQETIHEDRKSYAAQILECVALDQISAVVIARQVDSIPHILELKECVTSLRKAFRHHAILSSRNWCLPSAHHYSNADGHHHIYSLLDDAKHPTVLIMGGVGDTQDPFQAGECFLKFSLGSSSSWTYMPCLPQRRSGHETVFMNGKLYILGGFVHSPPRLIPKPTNSVIYYDERFAKWYEASPMLKKRAHFASAYAETDHLYVIGGETDCFEPTDVCEVYSVKYDQWSQIETLSVGRIGLCACLHSGLIYVVGGLVDEMVLELVECYNIEENSWSSKSPLPQGLCYGRLVEVGGLMFYLGGTCISSPQNHDCLGARPSLKSSATIFEYDELHDCWKAVACLPAPCHFISTAALGSKIYILGGFSTETWEYSTDTVCFHCKSCQLDSCALPPLPFGIIKAAAVGIIMTND